MLVSFHGKTRQGSEGLTVVMVCVFITTNHISRDTIHALSQVLCEGSCGDALARVMPYKATCLTKVHPGNVGTTFSNNCVQNSTAERSRVARNLESVFDFLCGKRACIRPLPIGDHRSCNPMTSGLRFESTRRCFGSYLFNYRIRAL